MLVKSTKMCFFDGKRFRPGTPFEVPEGTKLSPDMTVVAGKEKPVDKQKAKEPETFSELNHTFAEAPVTKGGKGK